MQSPWFSMLSMSVLSLVRFHLVFDYVYIFFSVFLYIMLLLFKNLYQMYSDTVLLLLWLLKLWVLHILLDVKMPSPLQQKM